MPDMLTGKGDGFRRRSSLERMAAGAGRLVPPTARGALRSLYEQALRLQPERLTATLPGGERIRLLPHLRHLTWNEEEYREFRRELRPGDVAFDLGANAGAYTLLFAQWTGAHGRVFAFEPAPDSFVSLEEMLSANDLTARVTVSKEAVGGSEGSVTFLTHDTSGGNRMVRQRVPDAAVTVPMTTVDAVCRRENVIPRLIKIDVEGAELEVLRGARDTIQAAGPALRLYVEMHPHLWEESGVERSDIERELAHQRLRLERLDGSPDVWNIAGVCLRVVPCGS